jgi:leucyl/phenylalanyl-tRNA--protein transferase
VRLDSSFAEVIRACAEIPRKDAEGTWITSDMIRAYQRLHALGYAHCAEAWADGALVGGIYGVSLGGAFFGESMFASRTDASKVALVTLMRQLERWNFDFLDCQMPSAHLERFGAELWPRARFLEALARAKEKQSRRGSWRLDDPAAVE